MGKEIERPAEDRKGVFLVFFFDVCDYGECRLRDEGGADDFQSSFDTLHEAMAYCENGHDAYSDQCRQVAEFKDGILTPLYTLDRVYVPKTKSLVGEYRSRWYAVESG